MVLEKSTLAAGPSRALRACSLASLSAGLLALSLAIVDHFDVQRTNEALGGLVVEAAAVIEEDIARVVHQWVDPAVSSLRLLAEVEAFDPGAFRREPSVGLLYRAVTTASQIDAVSVTFEDGFSRSVSRIDRHGRRGDSTIPMTAHWCASRVDAFREGLARRDRLTFFDAWPHVVGHFGRDVPAESRKSAWPYAEARKAGRLVISEPVVSADSGSQIVSLGYPMVVQGDFAGVISADVSLQPLSDALRLRKVSANSITTIVSGDGLVIGYPGIAQGASSSGGATGVRRVSDLPERQVARAIDLRGEKSGDRFTFRHEPDGTDYVAVFGTLPDISDRNWFVVAVVPTTDLLAHLGRDDRQHMAVYAALVGAMFASVFVLAYLLLSRPHRTQASLRHVPAAEGG